MHTQQATQQLVVRQEAVAISVDALEHDCHTHTITNTSAIYQSINPSMNTRANHTFGLVFERSLGTHDGTDDELLERDEAIARGIERVEQQRHALVVVLGELAGTDQDTLEVRLTDRITLRIVLCSRTHIYTCTRRRATWLECIDWDIGRFISRIDVDRDRHRSLVLSSESPHARDYIDAMNTLA